MISQEYPKWIYPSGILESYKAGQEPVLVQNADEEAALSKEPAKRRGRPPKVEAE